MSAAYVAQPAVAVDPPWWKLEILEWDFTLIEDVDVFTAPAWNDKGNDMPSTSFQVPSRSTAAVHLDSDHRVVRYSILDLAATVTAGVPVYKAVFAAVVDKEKSTLAAASEAAGEQSAQTGRGVGAQLAYSLVEPAGGPGDAGSITTTERVWNFSHNSFDLADNGLFHDAVELNVIGDETAAAPNGQLGKPLNFSNPLAYWLAPETPAGVTGPWVIGFDYTLGSDSHLVFDACAANGFALYVNERPLGTVWDFTSDAVADTWRGDATLLAGTVRIRAAVDNWRAGFRAFCLAVLEVLSDDPYDDDFILTTSTTGWRAGDLMAPPIGQVFVDLLTEAQARGELTWWSWTFTATLDTDGNAFASPPGVSGFVCTIGDSIFQVLEQARDEGYIEWVIDLDVDGLPVLHIWVPGEGRGADQSALMTAGDGSTGNLTSLEIETDHAGGVDALLVGWAGGYERVGASPALKTALVGVEANTAAEAVAQGTAMLLAPTLASRRTFTAAFTWETQATAMPYFGPLIFDDATLNDRADTPVSQRLIGFGVSAADGNARPEFVPVLGDRTIVREARVSKMLERAAGGALAGRSAAPIPITARQRPLAKLDLLEVTWSVTGNLTELSSTDTDPVSGLPLGLRSGLSAVPQDMRINRLRLTAKSGTDNSEIRIVRIRAGTPYLAAICTIGSGTDIEVWSHAASTPCYVLDLMQVWIGEGDLSDHESLTIMAYGGPWGIETVEGVSG